MNTFELVLNTGLSKKHAAVYASLIDNGQQSLSDLHRSTQISRPALYELLPYLERRGLVSQVKVGRRFAYMAESPQRLLEQYETQVNEEKKGLADLVDTFATSNEERPRVKYFEGVKGTEFVFDDVIHTLPVGGEFYRYSSRRNAKTERFAKSYYAKNRDKRKLERLVITSESKAKTKSPKLERSVRAIPKDFDLFEDDISLLIYGHKTAYIDYASKTSFVIESEKIARFQHKLFRLLWKKLS
tara:strand:+ start:1661 stop:2389 length:729 start_codon:yes stop_codon:yes gene_type:complete